MLVFRPLELEHIPLIKPYFGASRLCDVSTSLFIWRKYLSAEFCAGESLYIKQLHSGGKTVFMVPIGGDFFTGMETLLAYCRAHKHRAVFSAVASDELHKISSRYDIISTEAIRDWFDYIYESHDLRELRGRRFHGQRTHINRFDREYTNHRFDYLTADNMASAIAFADRYYEKRPPADRLATEERAALYEILERYAEYGLTGGMLFVDETAVSLTIGEVLGDTLFVHIEKADISYAGAYQKTVNISARMMGNCVRYINREEDMGYEGLRTSKLSYHPAMLLEKWAVEVSL